MGKSSGSVTTVSLVEVNTGGPYNSGPEQDFRRDTVRVKLSRLLSRPLEDTSIDLNGLYQDLPS